MDLGLNNKTAIVCGSSQGIGLGIAKELAKNGVNLILIARDEERLRSITQSLDNKNKHCFLCADFNNPQDLKKQLTALLVSKKISVDILINNTGGPASGPIELAEASDFLKAFNMHIICSQLLSQLVVPGMKKNGFGRIINVISTSVKIPIANLGVSNTIRGAMANWSKTMANELGLHGITVNNVLPGFTETARLSSLFEKRAKKEKLSIEDVKTKALKSIPVGRFGLVEDIAYAVSFLASPKSSYINGINLPVDGGRTASL